MSEIAQLTPRIVWDYFDQITRIPRPSKKEEKIMAYLVDFAKSHGLEYRRDGVGNLVIRKPATEGMEDRSTVVLQSHVDMVCEKNSSVNFDFEKDPIQPRIADGWVTPVHGRRGDRTDRSLRAGRGYAFRQVSDQPRFGG